MATMEQARIEPDFPEFEDMEEDRVRQSEYVNMNVVHLHARLQELNLDSIHAVGLEDGAPRASPADLPTEVASALLDFLDQYAVEMQEAAQQIEGYESDHKKCERRCAQMEELVERLKGKVAYLSEKSSAEFERTRAEAKQEANVCKEIRRALVDTTRKREKLDMDIRRTEMEIDRLRKMTNKIK